jgi:hypothetical protein
MPDAPTPGEIAYAAYYRVRAQDEPWRLPTPFDGLQPLTQRAWDTAAQAVLAWQAQQNEECVEGERPPQPSHRRNADGRRSLRRA